MSDQRLSSPADATEMVAVMFENGDVCTISVQEERAFEKPEFLSLGKIRLYPHEDTHEHRASAVARGAFEWLTPERRKTAERLEKSLGVANGTQREKRRAEQDKVRRITDMLGALPVRLGLGHPVFDPQALAAMPFRRPTTVVSDTSGVIQGGLRFVSRHLHPMARVRVPAVVQMEIVNMADEFLRIRRASNPKRPDLLINHLNSQAGQRALLLLELHSDVEIDRTSLIEDSVQGLNVSGKIRSYADRLILEAARRYQSQVTAGHPVTLLTSDQGLARMALAEGMRPLFFRAAKAGAFLGRRLAGTNLDPFTGELYTVSICAVLWELATIFGTARLASADGSHTLVVDAIGEDLAWTPYHSYDDLLWISAKRAAADTADSSDSSASRRDDHDTTEVATQSHSARRQPSDDRPSPPPRPLFFRVSVDPLFTLVDALETDQRLRIAMVAATLGLRILSGLGEYRRFLQSGQAITIDEESWSAAPPLTPLAIALRSGDSNDLRKALRTFPSYARLEGLLAEQGVGNAMDANVFGRAKSTCVALAELTGIAASVHGAGLYVTPTEPDDRSFAAVAGSAYDHLEPGGGLVATGRWLEELIMREGIHPNMARLRLQTASERGLLNRFTEGSTTETGHDRHRLTVLDAEAGPPFVKTAYLYRGDFLIPGKSSSSLKINKVES